MKTKLYTLSNGDSVYHDKANRSILVMFEQPRKVLSTSVMNGGYRENLIGVFNHNSDSGSGKECVMLAPTYEEHMRIITRQIGLDPEKVTGMGTAALMENAAIKSETYKNLTVTAIVTGGVEVNGGRVGDPAQYFLPVDKSILHKPGTINIMLVIDADMPAGVMARALVTCTEAKTAALQELMVGSNYSNGLATGSGTDQTIIVVNPSSELYFESAGKHGKLGELIGRAVKPAVKEALLRQNGLCPESQHSVLRRMKRFGVSEDTVWYEYNAVNNKKTDRQQYLRQLEELDNDPTMVTYTSLYVHLLDQFIWGLLSGEEVVKAGNDLIAMVADKFNVSLLSISVPELQHCVSTWQKLIVQMVCEALKSR